MSDTDRDIKHSDASVAVSEILPPIARALSEALDAAAGERVAFMLVTCVEGHNVKYIANVDRATGAGWLQDVLERWADVAPVVLPRDDGKR